MGKVVTISVVATLVVGSSVAQADRKRGEPLFDRNSMSQQIEYRRSQSTYRARSNAQSSLEARGLQPFKAGDRVTSDNKWEYARRGKEISALYDDPNYKGERDYSKMHPSLNKDGSIDPEEFLRLINLQ